MLDGAGGLVRLGGQTFAWALAGQTLVAVAQPIVLERGQQGRGPLPARGGTHERDRGGPARPSSGCFSRCCSGRRSAAPGTSNALLVVQAVDRAASGAALLLALRSRGHEGRR